MSSRSPGEFHYASLVATSPFNAKALGRANGRVRVGALAVAIAMVSNNSALAMVSPPPTGENVVDSAADPEPASEMDEVWDAIREGSAHAEVARYGDAIAEFEKALPRLAEAPEWASQANLVRKLLAEAYLGRYRVSKESRDLARARELMVKYAEFLPEGSSDLPDAKAKLAEIDTLIEEAAAARPTDRVEWKELAEVTRERNSRTNALVDAETRRLRERLRRGSMSLLVISGVAIAAGVVSTSFAFSRKGKADRLALSKVSEADAKSRESRLDTLYDQADLLATGGLVSGIVAGVAGVSGIVMLLQSSRVERRAPQLSVVPQNGGAALWFSSRF